jgi:hypothetical protein
MKYITTLSIIAIIIIIIGMAFRFYTSSKKASFDFTSYDQNVSLADSSRRITNYDANLIKDIIVDSVKKFTIGTIDSLKTKMTTVTMESNKAAENTLTSKEDSKSNADYILLVKVIFSGIFCFAALFVVLSKKYDDETKKWAFSVLTLIAGVWIGTATK